MEGISVSINRMDKLWYIHPAEHYTERGMNELQLPTRWMNFKHNAIKKGRHKLQHNSIYINFKSKQNHVDEGGTSEMKNKEHDYHGSQKSNCL